MSNIIFIPITSFVLTVHSTSDTERCEKRENPLILYLTVLTPVFSLGICQFSPFKPLRHIILDVTRSLIHVSIFGIHLRINDVIRPI